MLAHPPSLQDGRLDTLQLSSSSRKPGLLGRSALKECATGNLAMHAWVCAYLLCRAYSATLAIVELPYIAAQAVIFVCIIYPMIHFVRTAAHFFFYLLLVMQTLAFYVCFGTALVYATPTQQVAQLIGAALNMM